MHDMRRPLTAIAASAVLALAGGGTAWACGGSGDTPGSYPGSYPGSTTTDTGSTDGSSTTSATSSRASTRKTRAARLRARHHRH